MRVRRVFRALLLASVVFVFISVSQCFGSVVSTRLISMSFADDTWYEWDGSNGNIAFDPHNVVIGNFYTHQMVNTPFGLTDHFNMAGATFEFVSDMKRDVSDELLSPSPLNAAAYFDGSDAVTVKVVGMLFDESWNLIYNGQILEAKLVPVYEDSTASTEERWLLGPEADFIEGSFNRSLDLQVVPGSVGLASGINVGTDTIVMDDPLMNMFLWAHSVLNFETEDLVHKNFPSVDIQTEIPEPVSIILLAIGSLAIRRRM